jgi:hypothetical protein
MVVSVFHHLFPLIVAVRLGSVLGQVWSDDEVILRPRS